MEYVYTFLLLHKVGQEATVEDMENVLKAADIKPDRNKIWAMRAAFKDVNVDEFLKRASMFTESVLPVEEIVEEIEEEEEEEAPAGLSALFG
ncbi:50S ribosomal protein P1 [bacterium]|nr:50S ribosomal protein P1 [bacterium]